MQNKPAIQIRKVTATVGGNKRPKKNPREGDIGETTTASLVVRRRPSEGAQGPGEKRGAATKKTEGGGERS